MWAKSTVGILLLVGSGWTCAQTVAAPGDSGWAASLYGGGGQKRMQFAGEQAPSNLLSLGFGEDTAYNDNILAVPGAMQGDLISNFGAHANLQYQRADVTANLEYEPSFQMYRKYTGYNRVDQQLAGGFTAALSQRWYVRAREALTDERGALTGVGSESTAEPGSPTALNATVIAPLAPELDTSSRVDLGFVVDSRTAFSAFGGYEQRTFSGNGVLNQGLLNTRGITAGAQGIWRATEHGQIEVLATAQRLDVLGTVQAGTASHLPIESAFGSASWRLGPSVTVSGFFGPQYIGAQQAQVLPQTTSASSQLVWGEGGALTKQVKRVSWFVSAQRLASDGGGLLSYVESTSVSGGLHRMLLQHWDATVQGTIGRNRGLGTGETGNTISNESASCVLQRSVGNLNFHLTYDYARQQETGTAIAGAFYRNQMGFGLSYQIKAIALGR